MSFVSESSGGCEYERPYEDFGVSIASSEWEVMSLLLPEYILSEDVRTRNDCEDERETEEEKGVAVEIPPVQSAQAILIGAGSELLRLEYRHDRFLHN